MTGACGGGREGTRMSGVKQWWMGADLMQGLDPGGGNKEAMVLNLTICTERAQEAGQW